MRGRGAVTTRFPERFADQRACGPRRQLLAFRCAQSADVALRDQRFPADDHRQRADKASPLGAREAAAPWRQRRFDPLDSAKAAARQIAIGGGSVNRQPNERPAESLHLGREVVHRAHQPLHSRAWILVCGSVVERAVDRRFGERSDGGVNQELIESREVEEDGRRDTSAAAATSVTVGVLPAASKAIVALTIALRVRRFCATRSPPPLDGR